MTKTYPVISLNGFLYVVDKEANIAYKGSWVIELHNPKVVSLCQVRGDYPLKTKDQRFSYDDVLVIASNDPSLTDVPKLSELEEDMNQLSMDYNNSPEESDKAKWNAKQFVEYKLKPRVVLTSELEEFFRKSILLSLYAHKSFGFQAGYKAASKKQYTEEDITKILEKFHRMNMAYLTGKEDDNLDIPEFVKSLKPIPKEVELEHEASVKAFKDGDLARLTAHSILKVKDGHVIVNNWKYE